MPPPPPTEEFLELYPADTDEEAATAQAESSRDRALTSRDLWARERGETAETPSLLYLWDHVLPGPDADRFGAFHTSEVPYAMSTLYMSDRPSVEVDHEIAQRMSSYWARFAQTGDPNGPGLPQWPPVGATPQVMEVGHRNEPIPAAGSERKFQFFAAVLTREE